MSIQKKNLKQKQAKKKVSIKKKDTVTLPFKDASFCCSGSFIPSVIIKPETVNHPAHYGGDTTYEAIKVIEAWELCFNLGNTVKYISRAGKKGKLIEDLKKAAWYLNREIENLEKED